MVDIKLKPKEIIKKLDKEAVGVQKTKDNFVTIKEKVNELTTNDDNNSGEEYAGRKMQNGISYSTRKGISKFEEKGKKAVTDTKNNLIKSKQKIQNVKSKIKMQIV